MVGALAFAVGFAACAGSGYSVGIGTSTQTSHSSYHHPGPPPHAKAYGYRAKHDSWKHRARHGRHGYSSRGTGVEIVYDSDLGVYVVLGHPNNYYYDGHYLRVVGGIWQMTAEFDGVWVTARGSAVPNSLRSRY